MVEEESGGIPHPKSMDGFLEETDPPPPRPSGWQSLSLGLPRAPAFTSVWFSPQLCDHSWLRQDLISKLWLNALCTWQRRWDGEASSGHVHTYGPVCHPSPQVLEHYGGLDFLVCNAGVNPLVGSTLKASEEVWDKVRGC